MNSVDFFGLCGFYGWEKRTSKDHEVAVKHESGVKLTIPRKTIQNARESDMRALLRFAATLGKDSHD